MNLFDLCVSEVQHSILFSKNLFKHYVPAVFLVAMAERQVGYPIPVAKEHVEIHLKAPASTDTIW